MTTHTHTHTRIYIYISVGQEAHLCNSHQYDFYTQIFVVLNYAYKKCTYEMGLNPALRTVMNFYINMNSYYSLSLFLHWGISLITKTVVGTGSCAGSNTGNVNIYPGNCVRYYPCTLTINC